MTPKPWQLLSLALASAGLVAPADAGFAVADHLECYRAKEIAGPGRIQVRADLMSGIFPPLAAEMGCLIKGPPKLYCAPVAKTNVTPPAPGGGPSRSTTRFLCYKVKCPPGATQTAAGRDQFGTHTLSLKVPKIVCAPASPSGAFLEVASPF